MRRRLLASGVGTVAGLVLAVALSEGFGVERFALCMPRVLAGYGACSLLGVVAGCAAGHLRQWSCLQRAVLGGALGAGLLYGGRCWPLPWVNLHAVGGGGGPVAELALVVLPLCGLVLAAGFFWEAAVDGDRGPQQRCEEPEQL
jgi:hypothetical protein